MEVGDTQRIDAILAKFTTLGNLPDMVFIMAEEFNIILNSCSGVFELQLSYDGNGSVQATVEEVILPVKYANFADVFSPTLARKLPSHAPYDHIIETRDG